MILFVALLRSMGTKVRFIRTATPQPLRRYAVSDREREQKQRSRGSRFWAEVGISDSTHPAPRWVHVDPLRLLVDRPEEAEKLCRCMHVPYIIAIDCDGCVTDVTARYSASIGVDVLEQQGTRLPTAQQSWWQALCLSTHVLCLMRRLVGERGPEQMKPKQLSRVIHALHRILLQHTDVWSTCLYCGGHDHRCRICAEARQLSARNLPIPRTLAGFKHHPRYVLESDIHSNECLIPTNNSPVGVFAGRRESEGRSL